MEKSIDLARAIGAEPSLVSKWERAELRPGLDYHHQICGVCGISMETFWSRIPESEAKTDEGGEA